MRLQPLLCANPRRRDDDERASDGNRAPHHAPAPLMRRHSVDERAQLVVFRLVAERASPQLERRRRPSRRRARLARRRQRGDEARLERARPTLRIREVARSSARASSTPASARSSISSRRIVRDVGVARVRLALQRLADDAIEPLADERVDRVRRLIATLGDALQDLVRVLAAERQLPGRQLIGQDADGEHVGAKIERPPLDVLGRHVRRRAEQLPGHRHALLVDDLRDAEVGELDEPVVADHDVLGLDVAMDDAELVRVLERARHLAGDHLRDLGERQRRVGEEVLERAAVDELGDDVALGRVGPRVIENLEDVLVAQLGDGVRLALQPRARLCLAGEVRVQHLDRDLAIERRVGRFVDHRHAALAHFLEQAVARKLAADHIHGSGVTVLVEPPDFSPDRGGSTTRTL